MLDSNTAMLSMLPCFPAMQTPNPNGNALPYVLLQARYTACLFTTSQTLIHATLMGNYYTYMVFYMTTHHVCEKLGLRQMGTGKVLGIPLGFPQP